MPALPVVLGQCGDWMFSSQLPTLSSPSSQMSQRGNRRIPQPETTLTPTYTKKWSPFPGHWNDGRSVF